MFSNWLYTLKIKLFGFISNKCFAGYSVLDGREQTKRYQHYLNSSLYDKWTD